LCKISNIRSFYKEKKAEQSGCYFVVFFVEAHAKPIDYYTNLLSFENILSVLGMTVILKANAKLLPYWHNVYPNV
jgi:hypothetical protein